MKKSKSRVFSLACAICLLVSMMVPVVVLPAMAESSAVVFQDFENGTDGFRPWMVGSYATWSVDTTAPLAGNASLKLSTSNAEGCYLTFPAAVGVQNVALRVKVSGNTGILRIGANGNDCHGAYDELTASAIVFTDTAGNVLDDVAFYDTPWGGIRFNANFDGYVFLQNENNVDIQCINLGIYHGSTNADGMTLLLDSFANYSGNDYAAIVAKLGGSIEEEEPSDLPAIVVQDFENGTDGFTSWLVDSNATWGTENEAALSGSASLKLNTANAAGCYVTFPAAIGVKNIAVRLKVSGNTGIVRIGANGNDCHAMYDELTTESFVFTDIAGNVLGDVAFYDAPWGGIRFSADFDGYVFIENEYEVDIQSINVGIYHGSTNADGMTLLFDDFATYTGSDYAAIVEAIAGPAEEIPFASVQDFENGTNGFTSWLVDSNAAWGIETDAALSGLASLKLNTANAAGCYVTFPAAVGVKNLALRVKVIGNTGIVRIGANGNDCHAVYDELTTESFVFTDLAGNALEGAAFYDAAWGGIRFNSDFDGYVFIENEYEVSISKINVGIYHGSTNEFGMTLLIDDVMSYSEHSPETIAAIVQALHSHIWNDATCSAPKTCSVCGETEGEALDHAYFFPCDAHCMNCGELTNPDASHNVGHMAAAEATCQKTGNVEFWYCNDCGACWLDEALTLQTNRMSIVTYTDHVYVDGECKWCGEADPDAPVVEEIVVSTQKYNNVTFTVYQVGDTHKLVVSGKGQIPKQATIASYEFYGYKDTITSLVIGDGITIINANVFTGFAALASVDLGNTVTSLESNAFKDCTALTSIEIPASLTKLGYACFQNTGLVSVVVPATVTTIQGYVFAECANLVSADVQGYTVVDNRYYTTGARMFNNCTALKNVTLSSKHNYLNDYTFFNSGLETFTVPANVKILNNAVFFNSKQLKSVVLEEGVNKIGWACFYGCESLTDISLPESVYGNRIASYAFANCFSLEQIELPSTLTYVNKRMFSACANLKSITLGSSITEIGDMAFLGCKGLESVEMSENITTIGSQGFYKNFALTTIKIPAAVTTIKNYAYDNCTTLETVFIDSADVAAGLTAKASMGGLIKYATKVYVKADITAVGAYLTKNFKTVTTETVDGVEYTVYSK